MYTLYTNIYGSLLSRLICLFCDFVLCYKNKMQPICRPTNKGTGTVRGVALVWAESAPPKHAHRHANCNI